jgi:hypothetical protein
VDEQPGESTIYSLSEAPPAASEQRRDGDRHLTLYRVGSIIIDQRRELCLIKNISAGGMMIRAYCTMREGMPLAIELKSGLPIRGKVSWVCGLNVGVAFDEPIDVIEILSAPMEGPRPRKPRIEVDCFVTVREGATTHRTRACDISQGGIKLDTLTVLPRDTDVVVTLPGLGPTAGVVRWVDETFCGITFNQLVALPQLVNWLQDQRGGFRATG